MDRFGWQGAVAAPMRNTGRTAVMEADPAARVTYTRTYRLLLWVSVAVGALTHGFHLFVYPLYITDEGIYMEQAWAVLRQGNLSPYTYFYDHAPAGWMVIAGWVAILPRQFRQRLGSVPPGQLVCWAFLFSLVNGGLDIGRRG